MVQVSSGKASPVQINLRDVGCPSPWPCLSSTVTSIAMRCEMVASLRVRSFDIMDTSPVLGNVIRHYILP